MPEAVRLSRISYRLGPALGPVQARWFGVPHCTRKTCWQPVRPPKPDSYSRKLDGMPVGLRAPRLEAVRAMLRARLGAGDEDAEFGEAIAMLRGIGEAWAMASTLEATAKPQRRGRDGNTPAQRSPGDIRAGGSGPGIAGIDAAIAATAARSA